MSLVATAPCVTISKSWSDSWECWIVFCFLNVRFVLLSVNERTVIMYGWACLLGAFPPVDLPTSLTNLFFCLTCSLLGSCHLFDNFYFSWASLQITNRTLWLPYAFIACFWKSKPNSYKFVFILVFSIFFTSSSSSLLSDFSSDSSALTSSVSSSSTTCRFVFGNSWSYLRNK